MFNVKAKKKKIITRPICELLRLYTKRPLANSQLSPRFVKFAHFATLVINEKFI